MIMSQIFYASACETCIVVTDLLWNMEQLKEKK